MIAYLKGKIMELTFNKVVILPNSGVGYEIFISELVYSGLQGLEEIELFIYHHRTENSQILFGFIEKEEKQIFEELIKVNGVGGKVALNILSIGINRLIEAIKSSDNKTIESIKGIGKKGASKIILELKDSDIIKSYSSINGTGSEFTNSELGTGTRGISQKYQDVINTLVAMGYKKEDIEKTLVNLPESINSINDIIPFVIRNI
ncbi:MAG: Holliday junction branch migration protein RuvA [Candidatus Gracilibacteria bacterium]|nr:Holliday junction branch migration protein RuvA [Candidatus Gracilibacteria bacterium]MDQ7022751.1 Holliday junction branch migration protein RuvA [Candidatus Gracilibacteria bacterium]